MLTILSRICGGLGLFLMGIKFLVLGLNEMASYRLKYLIRNANLHPVLGVVTGIFATAILQSSSGTTIILISLVESNLLSLYQATPIIMGANIGTTITAQLIAFPVGRYTPFLLIPAFFCSLSKQSKKIKCWGEALLGFSLIFMGIDTLNQGVAPFSEFIKCKQILSEFGNNPFLGILMGFAITAMIQSSSTGIAILQSMALNYLIPLSSAVSILLGLNIGTCVTTLLSSIHLSVMGKRTALIHFLFNLLGVIIIFPFIHILCAVSFSLAPSNIPRQIANAHTIFNIICTILFLPFVPVFVKISTRLIKK